MAVASVIHAYETLISRGLRALRCSHDAVYGVFRKYETEVGIRIAKVMPVSIGFHRLKRLRFGDENENESRGEKKRGATRGVRESRERDLLARNNYSTIKEDPFYRNTQYTVVTQRRCARLSCPLLSEKVGQDFHTGQTRRRLALVPGGNRVRDRKRGGGARLFPRLLSTGSPMQTLKKQLAGRHAAKPRYRIRFTLRVKSRDRKGFLERGGTEGRVVDL